MRKVFIETLGCSKNEFDSYVVKELVEKKGFLITEDPSECEVAIINTCSFIQPAREESVETILAFEELKKNGQLKKLVVMGCLAQYYGEELRKEIPSIDLVVGTGDIDQVAEELSSGTDKVIVGDSKAYLPSHPLQNPGRGIGVFQYLKIADGCDKKCAFCSIPAFKGGFRSRPFETVVREAKTMVEKGIRELVLVGQVTSEFGKDYAGRSRFRELLQQLAELPGEFRVRILYLWWPDIDGELLELFSKYPKIYPYFDIPFQHSHPRVLKSMNRPGNAQRFIELVSMIRESLKRSYIRSTFIVGYPGETREEFEYLLDFLQDVRLDRATFFPYSDEEKSSSFRLSGRLSAREKQERYELAREVQAEIEEELQKEFRGKYVETLIEQVADGIGRGRSYRDAPEIEGEIVVAEGVGEPDIGEFVTVRIEDATRLELIGKVVELEPVETEKISRVDREIYL